MRGTRRSRPRGSGLGLCFLALSGWAAPPEAAGRELQRLKHHVPGLVVDLGVGLWATPMPMDYDGDGDLDLVVVCPDKPYNGTYFFENPGGHARMPVFRAGRRIAEGLQNLQVSYVGGRPHVLRGAEEYADFRAHALGKRVRLPVPREHLPAAERIRANHWRYVDYDGDGVHDLVVGVEDWGEYGWDDAFDAAGRWTRGPLHGSVHVLRNAGTQDQPRYERAVRIDAGGVPLDTYGMPSPSFADFDGDADLDLICGEFRDRLTYFENTGTRRQPSYAAGRPVLSDAGPVRMDLCMIVPVAIDWDRDGDEDLIVGQEDGRVALVENTGRLQEGMPLFEPPRFFQQEAENVKFGALVTPVAFDFDGDADTDLVCGNTAGYIGFIENLGGMPLKWAAPRYLEAGGSVIRIMAGENGSIQGPAEAKWGYTTLSVADWDHDGLPDIVANSIWGRVVWFRNVGTRTAPRLDAARLVEVHSTESPPAKPPWTWWEPAPRELATQWRTTPAVFDFDQDGLNDLVMLDPQGFLAFYRRSRADDGGLRLLPGRRAFQVAEGTAAAFDAGHKPLESVSAGGQRVDFAAPDEQGRVHFTHSSLGVKSVPDTPPPAGGARPSDPRLRLNGGWAGRSGRRKLCIADLDGDGRADLLVNSANANRLMNVTPPGESGSWTLRDEGGVAETVLAGHDTSPAVIDLDGDGRLDILIGAEDGHFYYSLAAGPTRPSPEAARSQAGESQPSQTGSHR